jgi:hypothetical protein
MHTEVYVIVATFGLMSFFVGLKGHYHFLYLRETDARLKGVDELGDLIITNRNRGLFTEALCETMLPTFKPRLKSDENEKTKKLSRKARICVNLFYVALLLLVAEVVVTYLNP